jgi:hypothetical protein
MSRQSFPKQIVLAASPTLPHNARMEEPNPFANEIMVDPLDPTRFRWAICEGNQILLRSPRSYEFRDEAERDALDASKRAEMRHNIK